MNSLEDQLCNIWFIENNIYFKAMEVSLLNGKAVCTEQQCDLINRAARMMSAAVTFGC